MEKVESELYEEVDKTMRQKYPLLLPSSREECIIKELCIILDRRFKELQPRQEAEIDCIEGIKPGPSAKVKRPNASIISSAHRPQLISMREFLSRVLEDSITLCAQHSANCMMSYKVEGHDFTLYGYAPDFHLTYTNSKCSICHQPQYQTPSGITCANGHGGCDGTDDV